MTEFPKTTKLKDFSELTLKLKDRSDFENSLKFFRHQKPEDITFLRRDVTKRPVMEQRLEEIEAGNAHVVLALDGDRIIGDALLYVAKRGWFCRTGEVRLVVDVDYRGKGLGTLLAREIIELAEDMELTKLEASGMESQPGLAKTLKPLGFKHEGTLRDFVVDLEGKEHDLILLGMKL